MKNSTIKRVNTDGCMKYGKKRKDERKVCHFIEIFERKIRKVRRAAGRRRKKLLQVN